MGKERTLLHIRAEFPRTPLQGARGRVCNLDLAVSPREDSVRGDRRSRLRPISPGPSASRGATSPALRAPCVPAGALLPCAQLSSSSASAREGVGAGRPRRAGDSPGTPELGRK